VIKTGLNPKITPEAPARLINMKTDHQEETNRMNDTNNHLTFETGEMLVKEGEQSTFSYLIISGKVNVVKGALSNNPKTIATVGKGEIIGEMSMFNDYRHIASVIAAEKTMVNGISRDQFQARLDAMDPLMRGVMKLLVLRSRAMADSIASGGSDADWAPWRKDT